MRFLKRVLQFYVYSNIHVALSGFAITLITLIHFKLPFNLLPVLVALAIIISYNFIRYYEIKTNKIAWFKRWFHKNKKLIFILSVLALLASFVIVFVEGVKLKSFLVIFPFTFITIFYVIPLKKNKQFEVSFRNFPSLKIFSIAIAWAGITVFLPLTEANFAFNENVWIEFLQRIFFIIAITLPFDIRDVISDPKNLKTLPQVFGVKKSKIIGVISLLIFVFLEVLKTEFSLINFGVIVLISIISGLFLIFSTPEKSRYYTAFWVEAIPIFWLFLLWIFNFL